MDPTQLVSVCGIHKQKSSVYNPSISGLSRVTLVIPLLFVTNHMNISSVSSSSDESNELLIVFSRIYRAIILEDDILFAGGKSLQVSASPDHLAYHLFLMLSL